MEKEKKKVEEVEEGKAIVPVEEPQQTLMLFGTTNPKAIVKLAIAVANELRPIIVDKKLFTMIHDKAYVWCEGWTLLGALLGGFPQDSVEDLSNPEISLLRFNATCEVRTINGLLITKAESECSNEEKLKEKWEGYAIRSMAQTRATSKALRMAFGWIMKLAGYESTPAEETDKDHMTEEVKDGNGKVDEVMTAMIKTLGPKKKDETNKMYTIREIEYLITKLKLDNATFRKKVKDIENLGTQSEMDLAEIRTVLWGQWKHGQTIKRIKTEDK